jgi:8-oxo-dGTP pyrophosphatase MutT (NUDIX family)
MRVVGCFLEYDGRFLLLHRQHYKPDGNTWGLPGGKVDGDETDLVAIRRELYEETGYREKDGQAELLGAYDFTSPRGDTFVYVAYRVRISDFHDVILEKAAHLEYKWVTIDEADGMSDLIFGLHDLFRLVGFVREA